MKSFLNTVAVLLQSPFNPPLGEGSVESSAVRGSRAQPLGGGVYNLAVKGWGEVGLRL